MSTSLVRLCPFGLLVAGSLLVPASAFAQASSPAIVPAGNAVSVPTALVPVGVMAPVAPSAPQSIIDTMTFRDVNVTELLSIISGQYNVPIVISGEVSGKLSYIQLSNQTPDVAIRHVVQAAGLNLSQDADGTYIIGKNLAPDAPRQAVQPIVPSQTTLVSPSLNPGIVPNNNIGLAPLPPWGAQNQMMEMTVPAPISDEPRLIEATEDQSKKTYQLRVKNIPPSMLAYWLDPGNHEAPIQIRLAKDLENNYHRRSFVTEQIGAASLNSNGSNIGMAGVNPQGVVPNAFASNPYINEDGVETRSNAQIGRGNQGNQGNGRGGNGRNGGGVFQLPTGVDRIVAIDPQNALLVFGTAAGVAELRSTIAFLDRPLRQVEIEAQFVQVSTTDVAAFGIDFSTARGPFNANSISLQPTPGQGQGGLQLGFVRGNFQAALTALQNASRAKTLSAPRVTAINNLTASLQQQVSTPITLSSTSTVVGTAAAQQTNQNIFYVTTSIGLEVTPTINNDDTITVLMRPQFQTSGTPDPATGAATITSQSLETIANVRDNETIALGGLKTKNILISGSRVPVLSSIPLIGQLFRSRNRNEVEQELIIFLTARIVRRIGD